MAEQTILIADDIEDVRLLVCLQLRMLGYKVLEASDGIEAVASARSGSPNLILMDIDMPRMDGWEAIRLIRDDPGLAASKIVVFSNLAAEDCKEAAIAFGCEGFVQKDLKFEKMQALVESHLIT